MNVVKVSDGIKDYIYTLVDELALNDFVIGAVRPMLNMAIENNFYKVNNILKLIADKNGEINFEKLIDDTIASTLNSKKASFTIGEAGKIDFGDGAMILTIPIINKYFRFEASDFIKMKNYIINKYNPNYEHLQTPN